MEGWWWCKKRMCSWWRKSSSARLLGFLLPLVVVVGVVVLVVIAYGDVKGSNNWMFASNFHLSVWPSVAPSKPFTGDGTTLSSNIMEDPMTLSPREVTADFRSKLPSRSAVVGGGGSGEEAPSLHFVTNQSASPPPLAIDHIQTEKPVGQKEEILNITANSTEISPFFNETEALPLNAKVKRRSTQFERLEARMQKARTAIREYKNSNQSHDPDYIPTGPMYWNANSFHRSYLEMEKQFKVYVYEDGDPPIFHYGPCKSIYAMEGRFIYQMETSKFRTKDPNKAHIFFLPMSVAEMVNYIYDRNSKDWHPLKRTVSDYVNVVAGKYPYWNRSLGADHSFLSCHDWGPELSKSVLELYKNSIRALCNANTSEGFNPSKDVSFPEIHLPGGTTKGLIGGPSPSKRPILVFFAGRVHGPVRPILLEHWENKDEDVQVHTYLPKGVSYYGMLKKSKYCICPSGFEVASPRMVEALYTGCVPVLIKDHYIAPFSDVLNWKTFSVEIPVKDIPKLKTILAGISTRQYIRMQRRGKQVRRHFEISSPPKRYDVFHMILHSVWLRRLNIRLHGDEDS